MKFSLQNKFMVPTVILVAILMGASGLTSYLNSKASLEDAIIERMEATTTDNSKIMSSWIARTKLDVETWAQNKTIQTATLDSFVGKAARKTANTVLADLQNKYGFYELIGVADKTGMTIAASVDGVVSKVQVADRGYFKQSMKGEISISPVIISKASGNPVFVISYPIRTADKKISGIILAVVNLGFFNEQFINSVKIGKTGYAALFNDAGLVIGHPDKSFIMKLDLSEYDFGREMMAKKEGMIKYNFGSNKISSFRSVKGTKWTIMVTAEESDILAPVKRLAIITIVVSIVGLLVAAIISIMIARSVAKPINRISKGLMDGADQVSSSSTLVASSSQAQAEGASEQAASLEETSSSLEEMASMTKQNAENAGQADSLMKETNIIVEQASGSMLDVTASMEEISKASEETSKIIKTIDEIAFQTNLLALNAAVEAARAGEAGAGFAVVADEVRNLAMKAKDAAQNTSDLIEGTVKSINTGSDIVSKTNDAFTKMSESSGKVADLVGEIAAATNEQAQGIEQVNMAVTQMDKVVQNNAATAEESAAASEEMAAQSVNMRANVGELMSLISGNDHQGKISSEPGVRRLTETYQLPVNSIKSNVVAPTRHRPREIKAGQVIASDDDFNDF